MRFKKFILVLFLVPSVTAVDFTEDFESFETSGILAVDKPDKTWYDYVENSDYGTLNSVSPIAGSNDMLFSGDTTSTPSSNVGNFQLEIPTQLTQVDFKVRGVTVTDNGIGSQQFISLQSISPVREIVVFYVFCLEGDACELRVKFDHVDTSGQVLINHTVGIKNFNIEVFFDWIDSDFCLFVNGVDDGCFDFLELPENFYRIRIGQYRAEIPSGLHFDDWTVYGALNGTAATIEGDASTGIKNFARDINFNTSASQFIFGLILLITLAMGVFLPMVALNKSNTIGSTISFIFVLGIFWLIELEFWPDWTGIAMIIMTGALIGTLVRTVALGMKDATTGPALVAGSLGYFIITTTLLGFSGYATDTIQLPTENPTEVDENGTAGPVQGYIESGIECVLTGGVFTLGLTGDCSRYTETKTFAIITDLLGWIRVAFSFLFQLLTFQLPIPVIFSMMIVLPPAAALATYAFSVIRGSGS